MLHRHTEAECREGQILYTERAKCKVLVTIKLAATIGHFLHVFDFANI